MSLYRSLLRAAMSAEIFACENDSPSNSADILHRAVSRTNQYVCQTHEQALFATLFVGVLDPATGWITYINAGHNAPIIVFDGEARTELLPNGPLVGVLPEMTYQADEVELNPGETLLIYSDGVEDTKNIEASIFGKEGLIRAIQDGASSASALVAGISDRLTTFRGDQHPFDDVTMLAIHRQASQTNS
jgi:sigma-B regulation protein RsbU (phosphoserine phosphatase)